MKTKDINSKLKLALKIVVSIAILLILTLVAIIIFKDNGEEIEQPEEQIEENIEEEEKTLILDIPSMSTTDAYAILDILVEEYGEPNPQGLIAILKETPEFDEEDERIPPSFQTVTWKNIKYGYDLAFNFWSDGSLARKDTYYFTGHKRLDHTIEEVLTLANVEKDSPQFIFNTVDFGGAVFNIGITPIEIARTPEPITQEEIDQLSKEEVLEILEENSKEDYPNDPARATLEYENQVEAYEWILNITEYPNIMETARREWGHNYIMVKWQYEKDVRAHENTLK